MQFTPYLTYGGMCRQAFEYYQEQLGAGKLDIMTFGDSPMAEQTPAHWRDKVLHAALELGGGTLMASDCPPDQAYEGMRGTSVVLSAKTDAEAKQFYEALALGGSVQMPLGPTFWASSFGMVTDQFGASWMVMCELPR
ncbi:VOC family protein [Massilia sp. NR 4-1]|uniref:VOC family protein n=1 Tax=Massilia sp. NR 4-1 TaxID=1678028 RepID=UPI00067BA15C|nr:VOC family protein [Massilia sp. NR 4-1]AKU21767.1 3-demethylubiquinone-9 3-methyltransferase [Massilia sp. NR 4-1]